MNRLATFFLLCFALPLKGFAKGPPFPKDKACVAWLAKKTMFLMSDQTAIGINCAIEASVSEKDGHRIQITIPVNKFNSEEEDRDEEVTELLGGKVHPKIQFTSAPLGTDWQNKVGAGQELPGELMINGKSFPIKTNYQISGQLAQGSLVSTLSAFEIEPPEVAGGVVASVEDYIELHFHIPLAMIKQTP